MRWSQTIGFAALWLIGIGAAHAAPQVEVTGSQQVWRPVTLRVTGPDTSESAARNPFRDIRLNVTFRRPNPEGPGVTVYQVPGFYAANGHAARTSAESGDQWLVRFTPPKPGQWRYELSFRTGEDVALQGGDEAGEPLAADKARGEFRVKSGPGYAQTGDGRDRGYLQHRDGRYLRFAATDKLWLKGGADSPENLLGYADFDGTRRLGGDLEAEGGAAAGPLHRYKPHVKDWRAGDPTWGDDQRGKGLIGAVNYLASEKVNSIYFITMNVQGDGRDVWPWTGPEPAKRDRFDVSKLAQWNIVFSHMNKQGLTLHVLTQETENDHLLNEGEMGPERTLYYRELIARFAHHPAMVWNLGEENTNTTEQLKAFAKYIRMHDPYDHPIVLHTYPGEYEKRYAPLLGFRPLDGPALQLSALSPKTAHRLTKQWLRRSHEAGHPWYAAITEPGSGHTGVKPDRLADAAHHRSARGVMYGNLFAGGSGVEWYFGHKFPHDDRNLEDFRSRDRLWDYTRFARQFAQQHLPLAAMQSADDLTRAEDDFVLAKKGAVYAIYLPKGGSTKLKVAGGTYRVRWFNPRTGDGLVAGSTKTITGPGWHGLGQPPEQPNRDWVVLVRRP